MIARLRARIQRSRSRSARLPRRRETRDRRWVQFGPAGRFASGTLSGGSVGSEKCTAHSAIRKATMAAPIKSYLSQRRPALFWRAAGRKEPRMDASKSGASGGSLADGISGPGGCGRGDSPGGRGAGCLGIGSLQVLFCLSGVSKPMSAPVRTGAERHPPEQCHSSPRVVSCSRVRGQADGDQKKGPAKARGLQYLLPRECPPKGEPP